jgi:hypothetical protein
MEEILGTLEFSLLVKRLEESLGSRVRILFMQVHTVDGQDAAFALGDASVYQETAAMPAKLAILMAVKETIITRIAEVEGNMAPTPEVN